MATATETQPSPGGGRVAQNRLRWELLTNIIRKDLKVKYKGSTLGFAWSLANPLLLLAVYYVVFQIILKSGVPNFAIYLMSGLLIWNAFQGSLLFATGAVVGNANLVKKVRFPYTVLPLSSVGFAMVHFALQMLVLVVVMLGLRYDFFGPQLLLLIPAFAVALLFTVALALLVSALNVRYRDVQHVLEVGLLAWFWVNPVVYTCNLVRDKLGPHHLFTAYFVLNPMATVIATFQRALYKTPVVVVNNKPQLVLAAPGYAYYLELLAITAAVSVALFAIGWRVFQRMQADFAEEL